MRALRHRIAVYYCIAVPSGGSFAAFGQCQCDADGAGAVDIHQHVNLDVDVHVRNVLELYADSLDSDRGALMDDQTTITL
jgi:hypothetical protein